MSVSPSLTRAPSRPLAEAVPATVASLRVVVPLAERLHQLRDMLAVAGPDAVASHAAAAHLWGFSELLPWRTEVSSPRCDRYRVRKVRAHRSLDLGPADVTEHRGFAVTTVARMIVDLSGRCSEWALLEVFDRAAREGWISHAELTACCERLRQAPGRRRSVVRALLERRAPGTPRLSALALRTEAVVHAAGLPKLGLNVRVSPRPNAPRLALTYVGSRVGVVCGTWGYTPSAAEEALSGELERSGWRIVHVTWDMSDREIVAAIGTALTRRR